MKKSIYLGMLEMKDQISLPIDQADQAFIDYLVAYKITRYCRI